MRTGRHGHQTTSHLMKHSVVSWLAAKGWSIDEIADFTSTDRETVRRIYRKVNPESLRGMADDLARTPVFGPTGPRNGSLERV